MYLKKINKDDLILNLGYCFYQVNEEEQSIERVIYIFPKREYGYHAKKLNKALNTGLISQSIFDSIKELESNEAKFHVLGFENNINKQTLLDLISKSSVQGIEDTESSFSILSQLNERNYQLISKL